MYKMILCIGRYESDMKDLEAKEKKLNKEKKLLGKATTEYNKKKEERERVQNDLSSSLIDAARGFARNEG
jgi:hypothetical protein